MQIHQALRAAIGEPVLAAERVPLGEHKPGGQLASEPEEEKGRSKGYLFVLRALLSEDPRDHAGAAFAHLGGGLHLPHHGEGPRAFGGRGQASRLPGGFRSRLPRARRRRGQALLRDRHRGAAAHPRRVLQVPVFVRTQLKTDLQEPLRRVQGAHHHRQHQPRDRAARAIGVRRRARRDSEALRQQQELRLLPRQHAAGQGRPHRAHQRAHQDDLRQGFNI